MIEVQQALKILRKTSPKQIRESRDLKDSLGYVLSEEIIAPIDLPNFDQSAMDGYAVNVKTGNEVYEMIGEVQAGSANEPVLLPGQCVRIFTGAKVPVTANTVIQQEWAITNGNEVRFDRAVEKGRNIRPKGEQIKKGSMALEKGSVLNAASIGFLAGMGITELPVCRKPTVHILTTGNELIPPGHDLAPGQIFESNSIMLQSALNTFGFDEVQVATVPDDYEQTVQVIKTALENADLLMLSGGISVGDYDYVYKALLENQVNELFYKVNQKPGKPLYFGKKDQQIVAALPGNPAAALSCFYIYVLPTLNQMYGKGFQGLKTSKALMAESYSKKGSRAQFLKAKLDKNQVRPLGGQSSAMLKSFSEANVLIYIPTEAETVLKGEEVLVYHIHV